MLHTVGKYVLVATLGITAFSNASANHVKGTINLPGLPADIAVNNLTNRIYVAIPSFGGPTDTLAVIDGTTDTLINSISIPTVGYQVAVDVVRNLVYVGGCFEDASSLTHCEVAVVDGGSNTVLRTVPVTTTPGNGIQGLAVNPISGDLYVSNASDNVIDVVKPGASKPFATIALGGEFPVGIATDPSTSPLYIAESNNEVTLADRVTKQLISTTTVGTTNSYLAISWSTGHVFVVDNTFGESNVNVLDKAGNILATVPVGNTPFDIDVDQTTNNAFVTNIISNTVSIISGRSNTVLQTLPVSGTFIAANSSSQKVYVSGQTNEVIVITEN